MRNLAIAAAIACSGSALWAADHGGPRPAAAAEPSFGRDMAQAMSRMDQGMAIAHTGNPDRDFAAMMIPHHQGAIDMARAELAYGRDAVLRRLAQGIIVEQQQEIELMRRQLDEAPAARAPRAPPSRGRKEE